MISLWERSQSIEEEIIESVCWCNKFRIKKEKQKNLMFFFLVCFGYKELPFCHKRKKILLLRERMCCVSRYFVK